MSPFKTLSSHIVTKVLLLLCFAQGVKAQQVLTLHEAIRITMENNFDIRIAENDVEIAENSVNRANAGMIPSVNADFIRNNSIQNNSQTRASGEVIDRRNVPGSNQSYGVSLNWTVFDGFRMFARYDQLKELEKLGETNFQLTVLSRVSDVMIRYYDLVQQQQQLSALDTAVIISRQRVNMAQTRFEIGKAARLEVLNAQVDFNTDTTVLLQQRNLYRTTQIALNELMGRSVDIEFSVVSSFPINNKLILGHLKEAAMQQNPSLRAALISKRIAELDLKQIKANRYPAVGINTGYNFSRSEAPLGFAILNTGRGFNYGLTASLTIFNGFLQRQNERNAAISIKSSQLDYERVNLNVTSQLSSAFNTYQTNLGLVRLEENNQRIAKQNLEITLEKYRLGSITQIEIRDAQLNYVNASVRLSNARYQAKLAEVSLLEISGNLNLNN